MNSDFEEFNQYVYWSIHGIFLDGLIWCLGPYVDDTRDYGLFRIYLARVTRSLLRRVIRLASQPPSL